MIYMGLINRYFFKSDRRYPYYWQRDVCNNLNILNISCRLPYVGSRRTYVFSEEKTKNISLTIPNISHLRFVSKFSNSSSHHDTISQLYSILIWTLISLLHEKCLHIPYNLLPSLLESANAHDVYFFLYLTQWRFKQTAS